MHSLIRKIGFFTAFILPILVIVGFYLGSFWNYCTLLFAFVILPLIDQFLGVDTRNVPVEKQQVVSDDFFYRFVTYVWTYVQLAFIGWGMYAVTNGQLHTVWDWIGFTLSFGIVTGGIGITVAHELGHKKSKLERFYSKVLLMTVCYMHFYIEHNKGHHVTVATPIDPATSRKNENFYAFWLRSVVQGYLHAWSLERERLRKIGVPFFSLSNNMIWFTLLPIVFVTVVTLLFSLLNQRFVWEVSVFFFAQSFIAFTLLEQVNYVEHYGMIRREVSPGRYEHVNPLHSWNASHLISNFFLFQLQRHSDHHAFAYKRYQVLDHHEVSPQLPFGYPTMVLLALVPPAWFSTMNTKLEHWRARNIENKEGVLS